MASEHNYWFLVRQFAITDFKLRYNNSILGYFWSLLNPLLQFGVLLLVFSIFIRFDVPHYNLYLLLGIVMWGFLVESTNNSMNSMLGKAPLIKKIYFPRQIVIIASNITSSISFILNMFLFSLFFIFFKVQLSFTVIFLPIYLILFFIFIIGLSFLLSALYVRFRDISHLWGIFLQLSFWFTPIVYPITLVPEKYRFFFNFNPMYTVIHNLREILIYGRMPELFSTVVLAISSLALFFIGYFIFDEMSDKFAEYI